MNLVCEPLATNTPVPFFVISTLRKASVLPTFKVLQSMTIVSPSVAAFRYLQNCEGIRKIQLHVTLKYAQVKLHRT